MRISLITSLALLCALASCSLERIPLSCETDTDCPDGYRCDALGNRCMRWIEPPAEDASVVDAAAGDRHLDAAGQDRTADASAGPDTAAVPDRAIAPDATPPPDAARADQRVADTTVSAPDVCVSSCEGVCGGGSDGCGGTCSATCPLGESCVSNQCVCAPDCAGRCGGVDDGCGGSCLATCPAGQWCDGMNCQPCAIDDDLHCGASCQDCTLNVNDRFCVNGSCGCRGDGDCDVGLWCSLNHCVACDQPSHCGLTCESCLGPPLEDLGHACVYGGCGCWDNSDCDFGVLCVLNLCQQIAPEIDAWFATDSCDRIDVAYPQRDFGSHHWDGVHVYDWETGEWLGPMANFHVGTTCGTYFGGNATWPDSYYRFHGTRAEFRQRGLPRYIKFRFINPAAEAYTGASNRVDLGQ